MNGNTEKSLRYPVTIFVFSINQNNYQFHEYDETSEYNGLKE